MRFHLRHIGMRLQTTCGTAAWLWMVATLSACSAWPAVAAVPAATAAPLRVLILSGANNHDWRTTTPALKQTLEDSGLFSIGITESPALIPPSDLDKYDVLVGNWNTFGAATPGHWPQPLMDAFTNFIRRGGGLVVVHAGGSTLYDWPDFQRLVGATWGSATGHGPKHMFSVAIADTNHPVTAGMASFNITDELWHRMMTNNEVHVLATAFSAKDKGGSGLDEPVAFVTQWGKGRCFNLVLGDDADAMNAGGFRALLVRGTEWAATGKVTAQATDSLLAAAVKRVVSAVLAWRHGEDRRPIETLASMAQETAVTPKARAMMAKQLAAVLSSNAAVEARAALCNALGIVGGNAEVAALSPLLRNKDRAFAARTALERIPGDKALIALRTALGSATAVDRIGLVNSLAARRDRAAVPLLERLVSNKNADVASAAIAGLGRIGGDDAVQILLACGSEVPVTLRADVAAALLSCADDVRAAHPPAAAPLFTRLIGNDQPRAVRCAALAGYVACVGEAGADLLFAALSCDDPRMRTAAVRALADAGSTQMVRQAAARLASMPPDLAVQMIAVLGGRGDRATMSPVVAALSSDSTEVRCAAIAALATLGSAACVQPLLARLGSADRAEREAVCCTLCSIADRDVDALLTAALTNRSIAARGEVLKVLAARGTPPPAPELLALAREAGNDPALRTACIKELAAVGTADMRAPLIALLSGAETQDRALVTTLATLCLNAGDVVPVLDALASSNSAPKESLVGVLACVGGADALAAVRAALRAPGTRRAAVRALVQWRDVAAIDDLVALAAPKGDRTERVLALRGIARLASATTNLPPAMVVGIVTSVLPAAIASATDPAGAEGLGAVARLAETLPPVLRTITRDGCAMLLTNDFPAAAQEPVLRMMIALDMLTNVAIGATADSPDNLDADGASGGDAAAIDGDPTTFWDETDNRGPYCLRITLDRAETLFALRITRFSPGYSPRDFAVVCDGTQVASLRDAAYENDQCIVPLRNTRCTSIELKITGVTGPSPAICELELLGRRP